jgi:hypothetical protein
MQVNKAKDFVERVAWTFFQAEIGLGLLDWLSGGINLSFWHTVYASLGAAAAATIKVLLAQNLGKHPDGAAIPGGITDAS